MAVPDSVTLHNLNGKFAVNKELSGDTDAVLNLQGIGWVVRKAIKHSSVTLDIKHSGNQINIEQTATGNMKTLEERTLDGQYKEKDDGVFGKIKRQTKFVPITEVHESWLTDGWDQKSLELDNGELIHTSTESVGASGDQWAVEQTWGFENIGGHRRYARHLVAKRGSKVEKSKIVYDFVAQ